MRKKILTFIILAIFLLPLALPVVAADDTAATYDEVRQLLSKPSLRIKIPGLKFTDVSALPIEESGSAKYIIIPYIGEYIAAAYKYAVILIGIAAVIEIIVAGIIWMMQMSGEESITGAKKKIVNGVIGIVIAVGSYTLLYTINPNLVQFRGLRIKFVERVEYSPEPSLDDNYYNDPSNAVATNVERPTWTATSYNCEVDKHTPRGVAPEAETQSFTCPVGIKEGSYFRVLPELKERVCKVAERLAAQGYGIEITDSYRPYSRQWEYWCAPKNQNMPPAERKKFIAVPGFSNHGHARAIDVALIDRNGNRLFKKGQHGSPKGQCTIDPQYVKILADAFLAEGFKRLETEVWHFSYGSTEGGDYNTLPKHCSAQTEN